MSYVPGFDWDLFISYSADDNDEGIVEEFVQVLTKHLSDNLTNSRSPKEKFTFYFDRKRLANQTAIDWEDDENVAASSSGIFVPLLSPNYLSSKNCLNELGRFSSQAHATRDCPFAVVQWQHLAGISAPGELSRAQRHPPDTSWLESMSRNDRIDSARKFALKLRDSLVKMRESVSAVFLGPAKSARGIATRRRLRDELERASYRVVPDQSYQYKNDQEVRKYLEESLLGIHFPGDGLDTHGVSAIEESFRYASKTLLIEPKGSSLSANEQSLLNTIFSELKPGGPLAGKSWSHRKETADGEVWAFVEKEVRVARFQKNRDKYEIGIACLIPDLPGARTVEGVFKKFGVRAKCPPYDTAVKISEKMQALETICTNSDWLICYWASPQGDELRRQLLGDSIRKYQAKAWYLAPPLDDPHKIELTQEKAEWVLMQNTADVDQAALQEFVEKLGWRPATT